MGTRVGEFEKDPIIQIEMTYLGNFIAKKCWQLSYRLNLSPGLDLQNSTQFCAQTLYIEFHLWSYFQTNYIWASFIGIPKYKEQFIG